MGYSRLAIIGAAVALCGFGSIRSASAAAKYVVTDLGTLGGNYSRAWDINNGGEVVGEAYTTTGNSPDHAFLYNASVPVQDVGTLGGSNSVAYGVNDNGQIVGSAQTSRGIYGGSYTYTTHAFLKTGSGALQDLGTLAGTRSEAYGINSSGQVVGWSDTNVSQRAFLYNGSGPMQDLGTFSGTNNPRNSAANAINDGGQIVGWSDADGGYQQAFLYTSSAGMQNLGALHEEYNNSGVLRYSSNATAINNSGQIVGAASVSYNVIGGTFVMHAFSLTGNGPMLDLGTLGGSQSQANGVNASGQIVGEASIAGDSSTHAFIYSGGTMQDLNSLIAPSAGWALTSATAINNLGQIVGTGTNHAGNTHAFLLTPTMRNVWITAGTGTGVGASRGSVTTAGSNHWYSSTVFNEAGTVGDTTGYINVLGTLPTPATDGPINVLVDLVGSTTDIDELLNNLAIGSGSTSVTVLRAGNEAFDKLATALAGPDRTWDAVLQFPTPNGAMAGNLEFSWDFTGTNVTLDKVAVVPEPASLTLAMGGAGFLMLRRSRKAR